MNPVLICSDKEADSVMFDKMWQRTQLPIPRRIRPFEKIPTDADFLLVFGEENLLALKGESDLFRWMGRKTSVTTQGRTFDACFMQSPSLLLPKFVSKDDESEPKNQLYRKPSRFQGIWVHWVQRALQNKWPENKPVNYLVDPVWGTWDRWVGEALDSGLPPSTDIETAYKIKVTDDEDQEEGELIEIKSGAILRISFSITPFSAVSVAWDGRYLPHIKKLLASRETIWWNGANFDVPRLREEGMEIPGTVYDAMDAWHLLESQLPNGLEFVSTEYTPFPGWKHLNNSDFGFYSCRDSDAALQNFLGIKKDLEHFEMWNLFLEDSVELMPMLVNAGKRGNEIDVPFSVALKAELQREKIRLNELVQPLIPDHIFPTKRTINRPFDAAEIDGNASVNERIKLCDGRTFRPAYETKIGKICSACNVLAGNKTEHYKGGKKNPCKAKGGDIVQDLWTFVEWDEVLPFNLASHHQIKELIRSYGHPLGINRKEIDKTTGKYRESANRKHLEKLMAKYNDTHPFYKIKIEEAKVSKTLSTYCAVDLVEADGLLHTHFVNNPWSWRLASTAINMQTWGKRESNPWAKKARRQIKARPGYIFVQADSTSIEAILTGFLISDPEFIQVAKESIHAYLCCQELKIPFTTENIELVKSKHKGLYNQFKIAVYLLLYGGDPYLMFMENPDLFPTLDHAKEIQTKIYTILPKLKEWQEAQREKAKKEGVIRGIYGHRFCFYDVYTFKRDKQGEIILDSKGYPKLKLGTDSKSVLAASAQNGAGKFGRDSLRLIGKSKWAQYMTAAVFVHDGYMLEVPDGSIPEIGPDMRYEAEQFLVDVLTREVPEMGNLRIPCESDMGYNWADCEMDKDPAKRTFEDGNPLGMKTYRKVMV